MKSIKPFFTGSKNDDAPECYNRVRYIRDSCKVLADLWKSDKDFLTKSIDNDVSKAFKDLRSSEPARSYYSPYGPTGAPSILNATIEDLITIHDHIDEERRKWLDKSRKISEQAKEKQSSIRQTMSELRDNYDRALRKYDTAESNFKKFQNRSDRTSVPNYDERYHELEDIRTECDQVRSLARDTYATEIYRVSSEEHSIARDLFAQFLVEEQTFYQDIQQYLSKQIPRVHDRLDADKLAPAFHCDLVEHCSKRIHRPIAYPIETCIQLLRGSEREEGLFRIAPALGKQKKLAAELDLQLLNKHSKLNALGYDPHVAAGTLKQYLRELPDCLLTDKLLTQWNDVLSISTEDARVQRISELINQLPQVNHDNLCYLIRFLADVAEHSTENKMTPSNLGICIGCSLLYAKDQPSVPTLSASYTQSSTIVELMIVHHKVLFPTNGKADMQQDVRLLTRRRPDLIPTGYEKESRSGSVEDLITVGTPEQSPPQTRKPPAPRPPIARQISTIQTESAHSPRTHAEGPSTKSPPVEHITAPSSPGLQVTRRSRHRNLSGDNELERSVAPPPIRPRPSKYQKEPEVSESTSSDVSLVSPSSDDGVQSGKSTPDLHTRVANSTLNSGSTNHLRSSPPQQPHTPVSPEEITQF